MTKPNLIFIRRPKKANCPVRVFQKRPYAKAAAIGMHRAGVKQRDICRRLEISQEHLTSFLTPFSWFRL
ncbi:hypothetical protein J2782_000973 [Brucella pseudogrignonensis]|uniref:Transposase n=1 Tax=Brucella pseudogrignonensis TaxID=419475 RepID=A0ABU1M5T9_9HYPH|nr:hypothetical protein [Brucella pseudogrignonensis]